MNVLVPILSCLSAVGSVPSDYPPCDPNPREFKCRDLDGANESFVLLVDKSRKFKKYSSSGVHGTLMVIDLANRLVRDRWPAGLGCHVGRKIRRNDNRSPEGIFHLVQRRKTKRKYRKRKIQLGSLFFLTSYPTYEDCAPRWSKDQHDECRQVLGSYIGLHSGRRTSSCTNGCIRITGAKWREEYWIKRLDERYVKGSVTPLIISPSVHASFYADYPMISQCWRDRIKDAVKMTKHNDVIDLMKRQCLSSPKLMADVAKPPPPGSGARSGFESAQPAPSEGGTMKVALLVFVGLIGLLGAGLLVVAFLFYRAG